MAANSYLCHTDLAPAGLDTAGHMLEVIVIEKDTLQIVDNHIDCPVGGVPNLPIVGSPECGDSDVNMGLFKARDADLCLLGDGFVDHACPVFFHNSGQLFEPWQRFWDHQADNAIIISLGDRYFTDISFSNRTKINHIIHNPNDMATLPQSLLIRLFQHLEGNLSVSGKILL